MFKTTIVLFSILLVAFACNREPDVEQILEADKAFSNMSDQIGLTDAFIYYADSNVVMLRDGLPPIKGLESLRSAYSFDDDNMKLTWLPEMAEIAKSGDLGYSYGRYLMIASDSSGINESEGFYVTIWKKQDDGGWKFVLDTGTEGGVEE